jgi:cysteine synthase
MPERFVNLPETPNSLIYIGQYETWKDLRSEGIKQFVIENNINNVCIITSGNGGRSLALALRNINCRVICVVDDELDKTVFAKLDSTVKECNPNNDTKFYSKLELEQICSERLQVEFLDVSNGFYENYGRIADDILDNLDLEPEYIVILFGSGGGATGITDRLNSRGYKGKVILFDLIRDIHSLTNSQLHLTLIRISLVVMLRLSKSRNIESNLHIF